jgi:hypothetical protein
VQLGEGGLPRAEDGDGVGPVDDRGGGSQKRRLGDHRTADAGGREGAASGEEHGDREEMGPLHVLARIHKTVWVCPSGQRGLSRRRHVYFASVVPGGLVA